MKNRKDLNKLDMRSYIEAHLALYGLGTLVKVKGPERGGRNNDQSWYQLQIVHRVDSNASHFDDGRIDVYLGYRRTGGYWNRRNIRIAIEKAAKAHREEAVVEKVWSRAQLAITDGRDSNGSIAV